ncbi:hypothetical protein IAQ61_007385 [Plenodomus lingam]|uniref:uncharacterized protein n=1 Tax=Leptosphaeria maculans TaxID=5022 RepID=UPI00332D739B|nr:hypothetical protein IAQ61_007385 [Plenodomus lingam]
MALMGRGSDECNFTLNSDLIHKLKTTTSASARPMELCSSSARVANQSQQLRLRDIWRGPDMTLKMQFSVAPQTSVAKLPWYSAERACIRASPGSSPLELLAAASSRAALL